MAYLLRFTGGAGYISIPPALLGASTFDFELDFTPRAIISGYTQVIGNADGADSLRHAIFLFGNSRMEVSFIIGGARRIINAPSGTFAAGTRYKINVTYDGSLMRLLVGGSLVGSVGATGTVGGTRGVSEIGAATPIGESSRAPIDLYSCKITQNGTLIRDYDPSLSGGSGTVLPDAVNSANNGTQVGAWPTDNSEWVFYSTGGTAYADNLLAGTYTSVGGVLASYRGISDSLNGGNYTSAGSTLAATQGYSSQLNGASFTSAGGQLVSSIGFSSTLQGATFTSSGGQLASTRSYGDTLNGGSYNYAGGILVSTVSGAAQSYVDTLLGGSYTSSGAPLASSRGYTSQLGGGAYTSAGGSLSAFYGYSSTLNGGNYAYSGNRLISTWSGEVTVTIEGYTIRFADDSISAKFHADDVSATFDNDHVSVTWRH